MIYIVGLGPSDKHNIKENIKELLLTNKDKKIITRIDEHPAVDFLRDNSINFETCDRFYTNNENFANTYQEIANYIIDCAKKEDVFYLLPGHPMVAEMTTKLLINSDTETKVLGGESFLDSCFNLAKFDPAENFSLLDATNLDSLKQINPNFHILITQCYDEFTASDIYLETVDYYSEEHKVLVMENVGLNNEKCYETTLGELQFAVGEKVNNLRTIYIPPKKDSLTYNIKHLSGDYIENLDDETIIKNIEATLTQIKQLSLENSKESDEIFSKHVAALLKEVLSFQYSLDHYVLLEDILKNIK